MGEESRGEVGCWPGAGGGVVREKIKKERERERERDQLHRGREASDSSGGINHTTITNLHLHHGQ